MPATQEQRVLAFAALTIGLGALVWSASRLRQIEQQRQADDSRFLPLDPSVKDDGSATPLFERSGASNTPTPGPETLPERQGGRESSSEPEAETSEEKAFVEDVQIFDRPAYVLLPDKKTSATRLSVLLHAGRAARGTAHRIGEAALTGTTFENLTDVQSASDQVLALMARQLVTRGDVVVILNASEGEQWSKEDLDYVKSAVVEVKRRLGLQGDVNVSGMAAGLLLARDVLNWVESRKKAA
jgi:hypothetical protein